MTTEKMPDVIWADRPNDNVGVYFDHKPQCVSIKYLRAEPVEELLKQARGVLNDIATNYDHDEDGHRCNTYCRCCDAEKMVISIDKFLGEK